jgi:hypothetical protein
MKSEEVEQRKKAGERIFLLSIYMLFVLDASLVVADEK